MNIMLVYGGNSCEHDISIITAGLAKRHFEARLYCCYINQHNCAYLVDNYLRPANHKSAKLNTKVNFVCGEDRVEIVKLGKRRWLDIDCIVNCCHGGVGEGGALAGMLAMTDIPVVGSGVMASAIAMDKITTKHILTSAGIPVVDWVQITHTMYDNGQYLDKIAVLGYPVIVKPATLGSSIGISIADNQQMLDDALLLAFTFDNRVLVEQYLPCTEYNCSAMRVGGSVISSRVDVPMTTNQILTFADKYLSGGKNSTAPADIEQQLASSIASMTRRIYQLLDMSGVVRVDYIYSNEMLYVNEINTIPGSLAYSLWQHSFGLTEYGKLLVAQAIADKHNANNLTSTYSSKVLDGATLPTKK